jgi:hypothetical protein
MPRLGDKIPLVFQLFDRDETQFIRAVLRDESGAELPESPVELFHVGGGQYMNASVSMPLTSFVTAKYTAFKDEDFLEANDDHTSETDVFELTLAPSELMAKLSDIKSLLNRLLAEGISPTLSGAIEEAVSLIGEVTGEQVLKGFVESEEAVSGEVKTEASASGSASESEKITGGIS